MHAMVRHGEPVEAVVRRGSELAVHHLADLPHRELPFRTVWDPLTRFEVARLLKASDAPIVQTYMGRATRLTHLEPGRGKVHVSRLGGYRKLDPSAMRMPGSATPGAVRLDDQGSLPAARVFHITNFADPARAVPEAELAALRARIGSAPTTG